MLNQLGPEADIVKRIPFPRCLGAELELLATTADFVSAVARQEFSSPLPASNERRKSSRYRTKENEKFREPRRIAFFVAYFLNMGLYPGKMALVQRSTQNCKSDRPHRAQRIDDALYKWLFESGRATKSGDAAQRY